MKDVEVRFIGRIDLAIFRSLFPDITTDEVIITGERIQHIIAGHPNDYERYHIYLQQIVEFPDFIIVANKPNSVVLLKEFIEDKNRFQAILRLHTSVDDPEFKNSIITFMKLKKSRYETYSRTKKILYKRV